MKHKHIVLDVETGGTDCFKHPITQLALQVLNNENLKTLETYNTFVKPYNDFTITKEALQRSQVTMTQINGGIDFKVLIKRLIEIFDAHTTGSKIRYRPIIVGHNTTFDMGFLEVLFALFNKDLYDYVEKYFVDTMLDMQRHDGHIKSKEDKVRYTLTACCERMGITLRSAHGAPADVAATSSLFIALTKKWQNSGDAGIIASTGEPAKRAFEM